MILDEVRRAIIKVYQSHPDAADPIANDPAKAKQFTQAVNALLPTNLQMTVAECSRHLINLRRRGQNHNGLPAKFDGHGPRPGSGGGHPKP